MKRVVGLSLVLAAILSVGWIAQRGAEERAVRRVLDEVQTGALAGLNSRDHNALDEFSATAAEGA